jgi:hypothetical protein
MTIVVALTELLRSVPCVDAPMEHRAAWYDRKAEVFDRIAEDGGPEAIEAERMALRARATASLIRRGRAR